MELDVTVAPLGRQEFATPVAAGDGMGPEIMEASLEVLLGIDFTKTEHLYGFAEPIPTARLSAVIVDRRQAKSVWRPDELQDEANTA